MQILESLSKKIRAYVAAMLEKPRRLTIILDFITATVYEIVVICKMGSGKFCCCSKALQKGLSARWWLHRIGDRALSRRFDSQCSE